MHLTKEIDHDIAKMANTTFTLDTERHFEDLEEFRRKRHNFASECRKGNYSKLTVEELIERGNASSYYNLEKISLLVQKELLIRACMDNTVRLALAESRPIWLDRPELINLLDRMELFFSPGTL